VGIFDVVVVVGGRGGKMKKRWPAVGLIFFVFWVDFCLVKLQPNGCLFCNRNYGLDFLWPVVEGVGRAGRIWGESESAPVVWFWVCWRWGWWFGWVVAVIRCFDIILTK
jgi:hypothetical protein